MARESLFDRDWQGAVDRLGGAESLEASARETRAFRRARGIKSAVDLLRLILAYCLGERGLRSTSAWAASIGLADICNVSLLYRLQQCGDWLAFLVGQAMTANAPRSAQGRLIRVIDGTTVPKKGTQAKRNNELWRVHGAFDLPSERFGHFELTDEKGGEQLDRIPAIEGEIRLADRAFLQPDRMAALLDAKADFVVRAGWKNARWLDEKGEPVDILAELRTASPKGRLDRSICIGRKSASPLVLRLVAIKKPPEACEVARRKARREAQKGRHQISEGTLEAADWVILVTSLSAVAFSTDDILDLYRLRWRIELAFKRLKSLVGLHGPPGADERSARPWVLAHLLMILLLEPLVDEFEDSPRWAPAA
jgi:hypothetical protein